MALFPFWIVTQRRGLISQPVELAGIPGFIAAFSTAEIAAKFMVARGETVWENTFRELIADLRRIGMQGLCLDPGGGTDSTITFDEMDRDSSVQAARLGGTK